MRHTSPVLEVYQPGFCWSPDNLFSASVLSPRQSAPRGGVPKYSQKSIENFHQRDKIIKLFGQKIIDLLRNTAKRIPTAREDPS